MIDQASRYLMAVPLQFTKAMEVWKQFENNWIATFGVPTLLLSYRGSQFTSAYWSSVLAVKPHQPTILKPMAWWSVGIGHSCPATAKATRIGQVGC